MMGLGEYHVVAGRIEREGRLGGCFAWVAQHPMCDAAAFMKAALEDNGWTPTSRIRVLADGADGLSNLVNTAAEETTHRVLDWFHISMRLRSIEQMSPGVVTIVGDADPVLTELLSEKIDRVRLQMWNGHWRAALDRLGAIYRTTKKVSECVVQYQCRTNTQVSEAHAGSARLFVPQSCRAKELRSGPAERLSGYPALWLNLQ